ncbi:MAG TPA: OmpA family protein [Kofleriaceae bacterium]|nr:OmpA family protein [Kofleriaceae bacterium]
MRGLAATLLVAMCGTAAGQGLDAERFRPATGAEGGFVNEHPAVPFHLGWSLGLFLNYADDQVVERDDVTGAILSTPVHRALTADVVGSIGLFSRLELGLGLPIHLIYDGDPYGGLAAGPGVGDLYFVPKVAIIRSGSLDKHVLLGFALPITFPTGNDEEFRGAGGFTVAPELLFAAHLNQLGLGLDVGYRWRAEHPQLPYGDSITLGPWVSYNFTDELSLRAEMFAEKHVNTEVDGADFPIEVLGGVEYRMGGLALYGGASFGLTDGIGDPDFRIIGGVRYRKNHPDRQGFKDSDGDGVLDKDDKAPYEPEDEDGYQDDDGKPEPDNDGDGVLDGDDECPELKGEKDRDGCPSHTYVKIEDGQMIIIGKIQFETGSAHVHKRSGPLLDQIAQALDAHPQIKKVRIEGNTDNVGPPPLNQKLSEDRAASVKDELSKRGVDGDRLVTKGNGETRPIAPNKSAGGRQKNRRVEFFIQESK